jgi:SAM-dependent methyltransferase
MFPSLYADPAAYDRMFPPGEDEVRFWTERLGPAPGPLLVLACGTGRLALPFARAGYAVTGLDLSQAMLDRGRHKAEAEGLAVDWVAADMRTFDLGRRFSAVLILGDSLAHLHTRTDLDAAWRAARSHLAPGGRLCLDVALPDARQLALSSSELRPFAGYRDPVTERPIELVYRATFSAGSRMRRVEVFERFGPFSARPVARLELKLHRPDELAESLAAAGFELRERCGDYAAAALAERSPRQLVTCGVRDAA